MIKTLVARTAEIDDIEKAVEEIKSQLGPENGLLKNSQKREGTFRPKFERFVDVRRNVYIIVL